MTPYYPINHASLTFGPCRNFGLLEAMYMFNKAVQEKVIELNCLASPSA